MAEFVADDQQRHRRFCPPPQSSGDFRYIDMELETFRYGVGARAFMDRHKNTKLILSVHDFSGRPPIVSITCCWKWIRRRAM
jgi:3-dehydroquinate dehydratase